MVVAQWRTKISGVKVRLQPTDVFRYVKSAKVGQQTFRVNLAKQELLCVSEPRFTRNYLPVSMLHCAGSSFGCCSTRYERKDTWSISEQMYDAIDS